MKTNFFKLLFIFSLFFCTLHTALASDTLYNFYTGDTTSLSSIYDPDHWFAQTFTATQDYNITSVKLYLDKTTGAEGTLHIYIKGTDGSGNPAGSACAEGTKAVNTGISTTKGAVEITLTPTGSACTLLSGTLYAIEGNYPEGSYPSPDWEIGFSGANSDQYGTGVGMVSRDDQASWTKPNWDLWFETYGTPYTPPAPTPDFLGGFIDNFRGPLTVFLATLVFFYIIWFVIYIITKTYLTRKSKKLI